MAANNDVNGGLKNHFIAFLGEFVGTFLFLFFAYGGTQTANQTSQRNPSIVASPDINQLLYIALIFGFSLTVNVWIFFRVSGGLFNPAVTLALCLVGVVGPVRSIFIFIAQVLASITAAAAVRGLLPGDAVLFSCALASGTSIAQGLFLEMFFTIELVFTILMLAAEKTKVTFVAPVGIGLSLFVAELMGVAWTGGALNPARAFGAEVIGGFRGYHWIYWLGPFMGAVLAAGFYKAIKFLNYEQVNGEQDLSAEEIQIRDEKKARKKEERRRKQNFAHIFQHGRMHQHHANTRNGGVNAADDGRPNSAPSYTGPPAENHAWPHSASTIRENGDFSRFAEVGSQDGIVITREQPAEQYRLSGERYVQDANAQNRAKTP
ncbi:putative mip family channel protein [Botrytis fragariae]|uniref:Putative mip family channel protein n=1 Tax=Botrytis fragariae TaxID=1964551 RepID=A0A8H6ENR7_9HELO|nr:putative mip family channel protein [Botrytis fragariae]KAF5878958.1 putative mip family channel protein [Botrytis fragariae]